MLCLCLIKQSNMKIYGGEEVQLHVLCSVQEGVVSYLNWFKPGKGPYYPLGSEENILTLLGLIIHLTPIQYI